ncbi:MAG: nuclear transport factor 2 family protein [Candidatus Binatia bacterium]
MAKKRPTRKTRPAASRKRSRVAPRTGAPAQRKQAAPNPRARTSVRRAPPSNPVRDLARRIVELTVKHDDHASFALYAKGVESIEPGMPPAVGIKAIKDKFARWRRTVSDSSWRARKVWVGGNTIIIEWTGHVTFAATGKRADLSEVAIHETQDGKIVCERFYYDRTALQP